MTVQLHYLMITSVVLAGMAMIFAIVGYALQLQANDTFKTKLLINADVTDQIVTPCLSELTNVAVGTGFSTFVDDSNPLNPRFWGISGQGPIIVQDTLNHGVEVSFNGAYQRPRSDSQPVQLLAVPTGSATLAENTVWHGIMYNEATYRLTSLIALTRVTTAGSNNTLVVELSMQDLHLESSDQVIVHVSEILTPSQGTVSAKIELGVLFLTLHAATAQIETSLTFTVETILAAAA